MDDTAPAPATATDSYLIATAMITLTPICTAAASAAIALNLPAHVRRFAVSLAGAALVLASGCSTLAPQVNRSAVDYSNVMEEFTNQVLVTNVLRARDQTPLNFSDLPIIHGSISAQAGTSVAAPFGALNASTTRNLSGATLQFSSSPTFDTSSLNTEAFTLNLLQPVSPVFIESLWRAGWPKQLLLHVFAESIQLPGDGGQAASTYFNRPDAPDYARFVGLVDQLVAHDAELHAFSVLDPVGVPISVPRTASGAVDGSQGNALKLYTELIGLDPAHYKIEYVGGTDAAGFQIYRRYGSQIALCLARSTSTAPDAVDRSLDALMRILGNASPATVLIGSGAGLRSAAPPAAATAPAGGPAPASKASSARSGTNAAMTQAVQAYRISGILNSTQCLDEEYVANRVGEADYVRSTRNFGNVRWRSTLDIYYYLGALARMPQREPIWTDGGRRHALFAIKAGTRGETPGITVKYHGAGYSVLGNDPALPDAPEAHGLQVISLLAQLVNIAKISNDIPLTRSFEILP